MPLKRAKSKSKKSVNKTVSENIKELHDHPGPHFKKLARKYGKKKLQQIRVAAAESAARRGGKKSGRSPRKHR